MITGANGFIGRNLCVYLREKGYFVRGAVRNNALEVSSADEYIQVGDINGSTDWANALQDVDWVIHLAGRVHVMDEQESDPAFVYHRINVLGTERLARMAAESGVKRFIFISSVKVNGEGALLPYTEKDTPEPRDAYGISKMEAEQALVRVAEETGLQTVILRLPLVYGPGVKANFKNLIKLASSGFPLPFKGINNRRSFIYLGNLADVISICLNHPLAAGETFMVSDGQDISTPELIKTIACAMGKKPSLFSLDTRFLKMLCKIIGKGEEMEKLTGTLVVDSTKIRALLGWKPPFSLEEGVRKTVGHLALC